MPDAATETPIRQRIADDGYAIVAGAAPPELVEAARAASQAIPRAGVRDLLRRMPEARAIADAPGVRAIAEGALGSQARVVRAILFDKSPEANWALGFHQDTVIAVAERIEAPGFGPWSIKDGAVHVQPPVEILESMLTVRVHLDDADESNGALAVIPGSHAAGMLDGPEIRRRVECGGALSCDVRAGDVIAMRPLLLHGSPRATREARRRVIHLEFAADPLPAPLRWAEA